jgi:hypothetical protein
MLAVPHIGRVYAVVVREVCVFGLRLALNI